VSPPRRGGIAFATGSEWGAYAQGEMSRWAKDGAVTPLAVRVLFAAMGRHDRNGHARFRPGELADVLGSIDVTTGEIRPARRGAVSDAIKAAKRLGYITDESFARCLVLSRHIFQNSWGSPQVCAAHGW
jgi:hypothetical protein